LLEIVSTERFSEAIDQSQGANTRAFGATRGPNDEKYGYAVITCVGSFEGGDFVIPELRL